MKLPNPRWFIPAVVIYGTLLMACFAHAEQIPDDVAVKCILGEARGEGLEGMAPTCS